jgi:hypothetical protein
MRWQSVIISCTAGFLVVSAVVGYLEGTRRSSQAQCVVKLKNLHAALTLYQADNSGYSPCVEMKGGKNNEAGLLPYMKSPSDIKCPLGTTAYYRHSAYFDAKTRIRIPLGIGESSVISACENHFVKGILFTISKPAAEFRYAPVPILGKIRGTTNVLLRSGSVINVSPNAKMTHWMHLPNQREWRLFRSGTVPPGTVHTFLYDFEPQPPQFEY